jgi:hypothetical protein
VLALDIVADGDSTDLCTRLINMLALLSAARVSPALVYGAGQQGLLRPPGNAAAADPENR